MPDFPDSGEDELKAKADQARAVADDAKDVANQAQSAQKAAQNAQQAAQAAKDLKGAANAAGAAQKLADKVPGAGGVSDAAGKVGDAKGKAGKVADAGQKLASGDLGGADALKATQNMTGGVADMAGMAGPTSKIAGLASGASDKLGSARKAVSAATGAMGMAAPVMDALGITSGGTLSGNGTSNTARFLFETAPVEDGAEPLDPQTVQVLDFTGEEGLSQLTRFEINLVSDDPNLDFSHIVNQPAGLTIRRESGPVRICGIVSDFQQGGYTADRFTYRAVMVSRLWRLSLNYRSRIFQNRNVEQIVTEVLEEAGFTKSKDFRFEVKDPRSNPQREYCVQYRETDFAFLSRLLEHHGIYYFFEHEDRDILVMTEDPEKTPPIPGEQLVEYNVGAGLVPGEESIKNFVMREQVVTGKVVLKDYNYRTPLQPLASQSQLNDKMPGVYYEHGQHYPDQDAGDFLAQIRNQEIECRRRVMYGGSDCGGMRGGHAFSLTQHYRTDLNGDYLITRVRHAGTQSAALPGLGGDEPPGYRNEFQCIPTSIVYRPLRQTPVPQMPGIMTARTASTGGEYAYIDEEGRYQARMHFDLRDPNTFKDGEATRPIRMSQPYSGPQYGLHFPNHADSEMVWACVDGNPDRPIALGTVPNGETDERWQSSPVNAENKTQNIIRTFAGNQLLMEDQEGETQIELTTPGGHKAALDDGDEVIQVVSTGQHKLRLDDNGKYAALQSTSGNRLMLNDKDAVSGDDGAALISAAGHSLSLTDKSGDNQGAELVTVSGHALSLNDQKKSVALKSSDGHGLLIKDEGTEAAFSLADDSHAITLKGDAGITIDSKKNGTVKATDDMTVTATKITVSGTEEIVLTVGASSITIKKDTIILSSPKINSTAMGNQTISGALIKIN